MRSGNTAETGRRVTIVTGASSGIGAAVAAELAARGDALLLAARRTAELEALAFRLDPSGSRVRALTADLTRPEDRERLLDAALAAFGRVDALVNNAGTTVRRGHWWDDPDPLRVLRLNLDAPIELTRLVLPAMRARGAGRLVFIGSVAGRVPASGIYSASKFGIRGFALALRRELLGSGVEVSLVAPGFVRSEMTRGVRLPMPGPEGVARAVAEVLSHPRAEVIVPGVYALLAALERLFPAVGDRVFPLVMNRRYQRSQRQQRAG